ncbi:nascent polypeptide-associated complex subunit alpha, muscle-specific form-like [Moschus berezovskii]|uniref:nascent polypeptide-associated complex subunit alpha, muscle-specific form-like n=1 Tax=Moschus berezovskii TaxID=68408 RepID=UPI002444F62E|nr:nascent polypeptide-associated complex subunit alpha, muscle-specific form-like [Moschus berezovskii]
MGRGAARLCAPVTALPVDLGPEGPPSPSSPGPEGLEGRGQRWLPNPQRVSSRRLWGPAPSHGAVCPVHAGGPTDGRMSRREGLISGWVGGWSTCGPLKTEDHPEQQAWEPLSPVPTLVFSQPDEVDAWAPGLGSLAGPAGAAKGIQALWVGFVGKGPGGAKKVTWRRRGGVLTGTHARFTDAEKRPRGPHPKGSREPTASASADPALLGWVKVLQPGSGGPTLFLRTQDQASASGNPGSPHTHVPHLRTAHVHPAFSYLGPRVSHCFPQKEKLRGVPAAVRSQAWVDGGGTPAEDALGTTSAKDVVSSPACGHPGLRASGPGSPGDQAVTCQAGRKPQAGCPGIREVLGPAFQPCSPRPATAFPPAQPVPTTVLTPSCLALSCWSSHSCLGRHCDAGPPLGTLGSRGPVPMALSHLRQCWPGQASHGSGPQPPECSTTAQVGSHSPGEVPVGSGEPSSLGSGHGRNAQQVYPPATHSGLPSIQHHPCLHLLQKDPTLLPGVGKARLGPPTAEGLSWKGPLESEGPKPQIHMNKDEVMEITAGKGGGACVPSDWQGGSSQEEAPAGILDETSSGCPHSTKSVLTGEAQRLGRPLWVIPHPSLTLAEAETSSQDPQHGPSECWGTAFQEDQTASCGHVTGDLHSPGPSKQPCPGQADAPPTRQTPRPQDTPHPTRQTPRPRQTDAPPTSPRVLPVPSACPHSMKEVARGPHIPPGRTPPPDPGESAGFWAGSPELAESPGRGPSRDLALLPARLRTPAPPSAHLVREAQVCTRPASLEAWASVEAQPHSCGFPELVVTHDPQTVPLTPRQPVHPESPGSLPRCNAQGPNLPQDPQGWPTAHPQPWLVYPAQGQPRPSAPRKPPPLLSLPALPSTWEGVGSSCGSSPQTQSRPREAPRQREQRGPALPAGASSMIVTPICDPGCPQGPAPHLGDRGAGEPPRQQSSTQPTPACRGGTCSLAQTGPRCGEHGVRPCTSETLSLEDSSPGALA